MTERHWYRRRLIHIGRGNRGRLIDVHRRRGRRPVGRRIAHFGWNEYGWIRRNFIAINPARRRFAPGVGTGCFVFGPSDIPRRPTPHFFSWRARTRRKRFVGAVRDLSV